MNIDDMKQLIILECKRVIEILQSDEKTKPYGSALASELKAKMHELRRDTIRLENQLYRRI